MIHAERVEIVSDEQGWELHLTDENGTKHRFNIHGCALDLANSDGFKALTVYAWEAETARVEYERGRGEEAEPFDPSNPKSPGWHDHLASLHDNRKGK